MLATLKPTSKYSSAAVFCFYNNQPNNKILKAAQAILKIFCTHSETGSLRMKSLLAYNDVLIFFTTENVYLANNSKCYKV